MFKLVHACCNNSGSFLIKDLNICATIVIKVLWCHEVRKIFSKKSRPDCKWSINKPDFVHTCLFPIELAFLLPEKIKLTTEFDFLNESIGKRVFRFKGIKRVGDKKCEKKNVGKLIEERWVFLVKN